MLYKEITTCRACGSSNLESVLDLGNLYISDFIKPKYIKLDDGSYPTYLGEPLMVQALVHEDKAPLELLCCQDCTLVQLRHTVDRDRLYRDYYYRSGTNESMVAALRDVVDDSMKRITPGPDDAVVDIGANDGTLLRMYPDNIYKIGFEPSDIYSAKLGDHIRMHHDYFPPTLRPSGLWDYKIITSIACFYDVDDPNAFVSAIKNWLHPDGIWVCQFQDFHAMMSATAFDNICHEHLTYWTTQAFRTLLRKHGLRVDSVSHNRVNGGSIRYIVKHGTETYPAPNKIQALEFAHQLSTFRHEVERLRRETLGALECLKRSGKTVLGYGASTKGNTLLQYYGIDSTLLPAIADRNPDKHGKLTVGTHIPIISEEEMRVRDPDYLFVLPWHFMSSFYTRESLWISKGGQFIIPLPKLRFGGDLCRSITDERCDRI